MFDVIIIGCGPAGLSAALTCKKLGLDYIAFDKDKMGSTIRKYRTDKLVQRDFLGKSTDVKGLLWFEDSTKDDLVKKWNEQCKDLNIHEDENVIDVKDKIVKTDKGEYEGKNIILCIGKQSNPRKLNIKGEDKCNLLYALSDASKYNDMDALVIGGGDAAIEAAIALSKKNRVTLSYRRDKFFRLTPRNQKAIDDNKDVDVIFKSNLIELKKDVAVLDIDGEMKEIKCDVVFLLLGFDLPMEFLRKIGIKIEKNNPVVHNYESNVKGLYIIGDLVGVPKIVDAINEGYEVVKIIKNA